MHWSQKSPVLWKSTSLFVRLNSTSDIDDSEKVEFFVVKYVPVAEVGSECCSEYRFSSFFVSMFTAGHSPRNFFKTDGGPIICGGG